MEQEGLQVWRATRALYVRAAMDVGDACRTELRIPAGALAAIDLRVSSNRDYGVQGPFLRLTDGTGWLFESKDGEPVMEPVDMATGLWGFRVAAPGVELLPQPIAMRGSPCPPGTVLWTDARVTNGSEEFAHVQDSNQWVCITREDGGPALVMPMVLETVEVGLRVYRARAKLAVRRDEFRTWRRLAPGELVAVDLLRRLPLQMSGQTMGGPTAIAEGGAGALEMPSSVGASKQATEGTEGPAASNGPFLRLTDGSGWLFETVRGERVLDQVHVETGLWPFRVAAPPPGIALAPHPVMMPTPALLPYDVGDPASGALGKSGPSVYPHGALVWADRKVEADGQTFIRVQGTDGWLCASTLQGADGDLGALRHQLLALSKKEVTLCTHPSGNAPTALPLEAVQALGEGLQYTQTSLDTANAFVVMIKAAASDEDRTVRVSVYYATGTVAVEHKEAHEQWGFRPAALHWGCSLAMLSRLLEDPHGVGSVSEGESVTRSSTEAWGGVGVGPEEAVLREVLLGVDAELLKLERRRTSLRGRLQTMERERVIASADDAARRLEAKRKEADIRTAQLEVARRRRRGDHFKFHGFHGPQVSKIFNATVVSVAMGDTTTLFLHEGNTISHTDHLPRGLNSALYDRPPDAPPPTVVALGSQGRYYVAFEDGTMEFEGGGHSDFSEVVASEAVAVVAFGEHPTSYFTLLISGEFHWCNVPPALDKLLSDNSITKNIHSVSLGPAGEWFISWEDGDWRCRGSPTLAEELARLQAKKKHIRGISFGGDCSYMVRYGVYGGAFAQQGDGYVSNI